MATNMLEPLAITLTEEELDRFVQALLSIDNYLGFVQFSAQLDDLERTTLGVAQTEVNELLEALGQ